MRSEAKTIFRQDEMWHKKGKDEIIMAIWRKKVRWAAIPRRKGP